LRIIIAGSTYLKVRVFTLQKRTSPRQPSENCAPLGYYAESRGNSLPTFRDNLSVPFSWGLLEVGNDRSSRNIRKNPGFLVLEDGAGTLSQNVGKELPLLAAQ